MLTFSSIDALLLSYKALPLPPMLTKGRGATNEIVDNKKGGVPRVGLLWCWTDGQFIGAFATSAR